MSIFKKNDSNEQKAIKKLNKHTSFSKRAIIFILLFSELQICASYVLAFLGRDAIAEALSQQIVITIVGTVIAYFVKSLIENLSKYTTMFGDNLNQDQLNYDSEYNNSEENFNDSFCDGESVHDESNLI